MSQTAQTAQEIYNAAAEATGFHPAGITRGTRWCLEQALENVRMVGRQKARIWIKAVEDLTRISQAERAAKQSETTPI